MKPRPVQHFTPEYLERCRSLTTEQICRFVEDFREMVFLSSDTAQDPKDDTAEPHTS